MLEADFAKSFLFLDNPWLEGVDLLAEKNHPDFSAYQRPTGGISSRKPQISKDEYPNLDLVIFSGTLARSE